MLKLSVAALAAASISFAAEAIPARNVSGNYIEARTADVYTGDCFANGEVDQVGHEAVFGWKIENGSWQGVNLAGLSVVGVARAVHTIGNRAEPVNPAQAVLIVDEAASPEQRAALQSFARRMAGDILNNVVKVDASRIDFAVENGNIHGGNARLTAGSLAEIKTRAIEQLDKVCGHEAVYYGPISTVDHAMPTYTLENSYQGDGVGAKWHNRLKRSSFVATFQVASE